MKFTLKYAMLMTMALAITFSSCRKKDDEEVEIEEEFSVADLGANDETARNEYDHSVDEIFNALEGTGLQTGRSASGVILPCGVIEIDSTGGAYKFIYSKTKNCGTKVLSGSITARLVSGAAWNDVGATISLTYQDYEVEFTTNNEILTFNGTLNIVNRDGGWLWEVVLLGSTVTHAVSGNLDITFDQNDTRSWTVSKKRIFANPKKDSAWTSVTLTLAADGPVAEAGTTKDGKAFTTTIPDPIVYKNCSPTGGAGPFIATTGTLMYNVTPNSLTVEAGYVFSNKQITKAGDCSATGYKLTYLILGRQTVKFQFY